MPYYISPQQSPISHKVALYANLSTVSSVPAGHTIHWRKNGSIVKEGITDDPFNLAVNTSEDATDVDGVVFTAEDTGAYIDFLIDLAGTPLNSQTVVLSNNTPTLSGAGPVTDSYNRTGGRPTMVWTYSDTDVDPQFFYRVRFGSTPGGADFHDSGTVSSTAQTFTFPISETAIPQGTVWYLSLIHI